MNIGIVTTWFERGAAYVSKQYRELLKDRHDVFVYARGGERPARGDAGWHDEYVTWGKDAYPLAFQSLNLKDFERWLTANAIDAVLFNEQAWWPPVLLCLRLGIVTAAYVDYYTEETVPFFAAYDVLLCNTRRHYSVFDWHPQAFHVAWGTDLRTYAPTSAGLVDPDRVTFFHSAGMNPRRKGTDLVLDALEQMRTDASVVIHTQVDLVDWFPERAAAIRALREQGRLTIRHETVGEPGLYHLGDVYVYPSRLDGLGLTVAEALACGLPVIASDNAPMNEFVNDEVGRLVPVASYRSRADGYYWPLCTVDVRALACRMDELAAARHAIPAMKARVRRHAECHLDWRRRAAAVRHIFETARPLSPGQRRGAVEAIERYEDRRTSLKGKLSVRYPVSFDLAWRMWGGVRHTVDVFNGRNVATRGH